MAEDTMVKDPLTLMLSQDTSPGDMVDMVMEAMEAMVVMDTMERERPKLSQDMVDMDMAVDMEVMVDTDAVTTVRGRLKPNQDTSPEAMDMVAMEAMEAMAAVDTMERGRPKPSQDMVMVDIAVDMVMAVDMAIMVKLYL